jgi:hypothetical protein
MAIIMSLAGLLLSGFGTGTSPLPPDAPILAVADDGDNTGATATITGSSAGSANVVYTRAVSGGIGSTAWVNSGNRTGDGTVSLALAAGYYWARVESTLNSQVVNSNVVYFVVTTGDDPVFSQCLDGVLARLQGMTFAGLNTANFTRRKLPWNRKLTANEVKPGAFITPAPERQDSRAGTNQRDDVGYGVAIVVVRVSNKDLISNEDATLLWRQQINKAFRNQRLDGVVENWKCEVEPGSVFNSSLFGDGYDVFSMTVRCWCRETRGLS